MSMVATPLINSYESQPGAQHHVVSPRIYVAVYCALLALTATTVGMSFIEVGRWHLPISLAIAAAKALLVLLFFMHVIYGERLIWVAALGAVLWLLIMLALTLADYLTR